MADLTLAERYKQAKITRAQTSLEILDLRYSEVDAENDYDKYSSYMQQRRNTEASLQDFDSMDAEALLKECVENERKSWEAAKRRSEEALSGPNNSEERVELCTKNIEIATRFLSLTDEEIALSLLKREEGDVSVNIAIIRSYSLAGAIGFSRENAWMVSKVRCDKLHLLTKEQFDLLVAAAINDPTYKQYIALHQSAARADTAKKVALHGMGVGIVGACLIGPIGLVVAAAGLAGACLSGLMAKMNTTKAENLGLTPVADLINGISQEDMVENDVPSM